MGKQGVFAPAGRGCEVGHWSEAKEMLRKAECDHQDIDWKLPEQNKWESKEQWFSRVLKRRTYRNKEYIGVPITCLECEAKGWEWYEWSEDEWDQP